MKTETETKTSLIESLENLPDPYKSKALKAFEEQMAPFNIEEIKQIECPNPAMALLAAFVWDRTEEGMPYWQDLYDFLMNSEHT